MQLGILKDVPDFPLVMVYIKEREAKRMALFPSLDYRGLYTVLVQLLEVAPLIQVGIDGIMIDFLLPNYLDCRLIILSLLQCWVNR